MEIPRDWRVRAQDLHERWNTLFPRMFPEKGRPNQEIIQQWNALKSERDDFSRTRIEYVDQQSARLTANPGQAIPDDYLALMAEDAYCRNFYMKETEAELDAMIKEVHNDFSLSGETLRMLRRSFVSSYWDLKEIIKRREERLKYWDLSGSPQKETYLEPLRIGLREKRRELIDQCRHYHAARNSKMSLGERIERYFSFLLTRIFENLIVQTASKDRWVLSPIRKSYIKCL